MGAFPFLMNPATPPAHTHPVTAASANPPPTRAAVERAADALRNGRLVILPTETVYGVFASGRSAEGLTALGAAHPEDGPRALPATWHAESTAAILDRLRISAPLHRRLVARLSPGPVRFVVVKTADEATAIRRALGVDAGVIDAPTDGGAEFWARVPDHPITQSVLAQAATVAIAARLSALGLGDGRTLPSDVAERADALGLAEWIDAGPTRLGKPSTTVRLTPDGSYLVTHPGVYDERYIQKRAERTILFVCTGNTCRSPMAEAIARDVVAKGRSPIPTRVISAGTSAMPGAFMSAEAKTALEEMGIDPGRHRSRLLSRELLAEAELIFGMTVAHARAVAASDDAAAGRVQTLDPDGSDVQDPIGGPIEEYRQTARRLRDLIERRLASLDTPTPGDGSTQSAQPSQGAR